MNDYKKALINTILGIISLIAVSLLWKQPLLLVILLVAISFLMLFVRNEKKSVVVYIIGFICGPLAESIAISQGAWIYAGYLIPIINVPIWLPFLWANASLFIVNIERLSHILFDKKLFKKTR